MRPSSISSAAPTALGKRAKLLNKATRVAKTLTTSVAKSARRQPSSTQRLAALASLALAFSVGFAPESASATPLVATNVLTRAHVAVKAMAASGSSFGAAPAANVVNLPISPLAATDDLAVPPVEYSSWQGTGYGAYMVPKALDVASDGGVDVIVHLNGALMADKDWRESRVNAIVMSIAIREVVGSSGYSRKFAAPGYLDAVMRETFATMKMNGDKRPLHVRRIGLVSWSAGFGGVGQLLGQSTWASRIDSVVLLDSIHAGYADPKNGMVRVPVPGNVVMGLGEEWVDAIGTAKYVHFAQDAVAGKKAFVLSHSNILPPDYASCGETTGAILKGVGATKVAHDEKNSRGMTFAYRADKGDLHAWGFRGGGPHDHFDQLHEVGDAVRAYIAPRWNRMAREEQHVELRAGL